MMIVAMMRVMVPTMRMMIVVVVVMMTAILMMIMVRNRIVIYRLIHGNGLHEYRSCERERRAKTEAERHIVMISARRLRKRRTGDQAAEQESARGSNAYAHNRTFH